MDKLAKYVSEERQRELISLAPKYPASAIRCAIEDAVNAVLSGKAAEPALDGKRRVEWLGDSVTWNSVTQ
jgi:hypothetical protein